MCLTFTRAYFFSKALLAPKTIQLHREVRTIRESIDVVDSQRSVLFRSYSPVSDLWDSIFKAYDLLIVRLIDLHECVIITAAVFCRDQFLNQFQRPLPSTDDICMRWLDFIKRLLGVYLSRKINLYFRYRLARAFDIDPEHLVRVLQRTTDSDFEESGSVLIALFVEVSGMIRLPLLFVQFRTCTTSADKRRAEKFSRTFTLHSTVVSVVDLTASLASLC